MCVQAYGDASNTSHIVGVWQRLPQNCHSALVSMMRHPRVALCLAHCCQHSGAAARSSLGQKNKQTNEQCQPDSHQVCVARSRSVCLCRGRAATTSQALGFAWTTDTQVECSAATQIEVWPSTGCQTTHATPRYSAASTQDSTGLSHLARICQHKHKLPRPSSGNAHAPKNTTPQHTMCVVCIRKGRGQRTPRQHLY